MSSEEYPDAGVVKPVPDGPPPIAFGADEPESGETSKGPTSYDSLLSVGKRKFKKKPVLTLDPAEAEAAANLLDLVAAQQINEMEPGERKSAPVGLTALDTTHSMAEASSLEENRAPEIEPTAAFREAVHPNAPDMGGVPIHPEPPAAGEDQTGDEMDNLVDIPDRSSGEPEFDDWFIDDETDTAEPDDEPGETETIPDEGVDISEPVEFEMAAVFEQLPGPEMADGIEEATASAEPSELREAEPEPLSPKPDFGVDGHRLRARIVETFQPRKALSDRALSFLRRIRGWVKRLQL